MFCTGDFCHTNTVTFEFSRMKSTSPTGVVPALLNLWAPTERSPEVRIKVYWLDFLIDCIFSTRSSFDIDAIDRHRCRVDDL